MITRLLSTSTKYRPKYSNIIKQKAKIQPKPNVEAFPKDLFPAANALNNAGVIKLKSEREEPSNPQTQKNTATRVLARDFIHDSLYNTEYGYFSKRAIIFSFPEDMDFQKMKNTEAFMKTVQGYYNQYDDFQGEEALQVWHTPTELFKPYYGYALANYILSEYKGSGLREKGVPLIIYEMGAGNGTMMRNILEYMKDHDYDCYKSAKYNIIEISQQLSERQEWNNMSRLSEEINNYRDQVRIINKSVFEWDKRVNDPCFFIALEVIDNFAHDVVRYNLSSDKPMLQPLQGYVETNEEGAMDEVFEPLSDSVITRYLDYRSQTNYKNSLLDFNETLMRIRSNLPFAPNMTEPEFVPTMQMVFMENLKKMFPNHRLILSDFDSLPTQVPGVCAPIVQTRQKKTMIPCSTYMVTPGWFDIFFPTDFELMADMYDLIVEEKGRSQVMTHSAFLSKYGDLVKTRTTSGDVPMIEQYRNVKFLLT